PLFFVARNLLCSHFLGGFTQANRSEEITYFLLLNFGYCLHFLFFAPALTEVVVLFSFSGQISAQPHCNTSGCNFRKAGYYYYRAFSDCSSESCGQCERNCEAIAHAYHYISDKG